MIDLHVAQEIVKRPQVKEGIQSYKYLMARRYAVDISKDEAFQDMFSTFYRMKRFRSRDFLRRFFECMEQEKRREITSFAVLFEKVYQLNSSMEISFCSKMLHTFDDCQPIWDSVVATEHFGFKRPYSYCKNPIERCVSRYADYTEAFTHYINSGEGRTLVDIFDNQYPNCGISDMKKIDFILWQDRKAVNRYEKPTSRK